MLRSPKRKAPKKKLEISLLRDPKIKSILNLTLAKRGRPETQAPMIGLIASLERKESHMIAQSTLTHLFRKKEFAL